MKHELGDTFIAKCRDEKNHLFTVELPSPPDGFLICPPEEHFEGLGYDKGIKDLGPVNDDGCLAEERTGLFPKIKHTINIETFKWEWVAELRTESIYILIKAPTHQEVIDIWNRRA